METVRLGDFSIIYTLEWYSVTTPTMSIVIVLWSDHKGKSWLRVNLVSPLEDGPGPGNYLLDTVLDHLSSHSPQSKAAWQQQH